MPYNFTATEKKWQQYWLENKTFRTLDPADAGNMPKAYVLDMFPYPSGAGLHVGHPEGYTATDIYSRYLRMCGYNVLHPIGWDAFGLPAEQYAIKTNQHPRLTTEANINNFRKQIQSLGLSYDWDREVDTTDPLYYKWTQWIFLQIYNSYFDPADQKAKPISHLLNELANENLVVAPDGSVRVNPAQEGMEAIAGEVRVERVWRELAEDEKREVIDGLRLAYTDEVPVNWCPALGTVLSNEEVIDGKSDIGGHPVERRPMRQWMMRITAYADRLIADLNLLSWPDSLKDMQRNWIGKSEGAEIDFELALDGIASRTTEFLKNAALRKEPEGGSGDHEAPAITVFTTRPDTLYGATYMVLAPEHELVDRITTPEHRDQVAAYRAAAAGKSDRDRMADVKDKTGVFTGAYAVNPINDEKIPVWIADYVLMGYGTGAIMAVPAHDERDFAFAKKFGMPIRQVVDWSYEMPSQLRALGHQHFGKGAIYSIVHLQPKNPISSVALFGEFASSQGIDPQRCEVVDGGAEGIYVLVDSKLGEAFTVKFPTPHMQLVMNDAYTGDGKMTNSDIFNGQSTAEAKQRIVALLEAEGVAFKTKKYKLRDWLFSRQRYWGEPFPIVMDTQGRTYDVPESELPVTLPELSDFKPTGTPEGPLSKATDWLTYSTTGKSEIPTGQLFRETNTMPQWAGSCWYYLRYADPKNAERFIDPEKEKYWMPVDLYVGGAEHAVLHLLYARFWHKILFDLGHVSTSEPFGKLINQGTILGETEYQTAEATPRKVEPDDVEKVGTGYVLKSDKSIKVDAAAFKMSKSRGNVVNPDDIVRDFGADAFRLYEMYMGPLEQTKPWSTRDIIGMTRFLNAVWRNLVGDEEDTKKVVRIEVAPIPESVERQMHFTIKKVAEDIIGLRFNVAIAELIKLNNEMSKLEIIPRDLAENFVLMLAPFAPHIAEELWLRLGHTKSLTRRPWPSFDASKLIETTVELAVTVNGKLRDKITVDADATEDTVFAAAIALEKVKPWLEGKEVRKKLYVPKKLVNFVVS